MKTPRNSQIWEENLRFLNFFQKKKRNTEMVSGKSKAKVYPRTGHKVPPEGK
jgi:hypothetical protein